VARFAGALLLLAGACHAAYGAVGMESIAADAAHRVVSGPLYLQVSINGNRLSGLYPFMLRADALWATPATLRHIGFKSPAQNQDMVRLDTIRGTQVKYDVANQALAITAPLPELDLARTVVGTEGPEHLKISHGTGLLLNYDLYGTYDDSRGDQTLSATSELRAFNSLGVLSNTMLSQVGSDVNQAYAGQDAGGRFQNIRLDTAWTSSWPDKEITLTMGDTITGNLSWTRATRIGGIQLGRDFSLKPYQITAPLPAFMGSATLPSSVDLYIDGIKRYNGTVPAGPFELNSPPRLTGLGNAQVVLTDALGRRTQIDIPFYAGSRLLARGLDDWSISAGYVREDYGLSSFSYADKPMVSGTMRYGVSNSVTVETHAETTQGLGAGGAGVVATLGLAGQVSGSYALSQDSGRHGSQYSLGYQWQNRRFNFTANTIRSNAGYRDVASLYGLPPALVTESAVAGVSLDRVGTVSLSYVHSLYPDSSSNRYAGAYWSKSLGGSMTLSASYNRNLNAPHDQTVFFGLTVYLGHNINVGGSVHRDNGQTSYGLNASQSTPATTGWGWSLQTQRAPGTQYGYAEADYRGQYGEYRAGVNTSNSDDTVYAGASGSLVAMGGDVFAGRKIYDGFAVVSTDHVPDIPVRLQNNPVGKTDSSGMLMVSPLAAYQKNLISINTMQLPADVRADRVDAEVATARGSGALVAFRIRRVRAATLILRGRNGKPLPLGASVQLNDSREFALIGYGGMTYLEDLKDQNSLKVTFSGQTCSVEFAYRQSADFAKPIGPLLCE